MATTVPPVLRVGVEEARALLSGDLNGLSDPYVQLELLDQRGDVVVGAPAPRTATKIKTLSPVWTESFVLGDGDVDLRTVTTLRFTVVDFDSWKTDDVLGEVLVPVDTALQLASDSSSEQWFQVKKVEGKMAKDATGELRITFTREAPGASAKKAAAASKESTETAEATEEGDEPNLLYVTIESGRDLLPMDDKDRTSDPTVKLSLTGQLFQTASVAKTLKPHWDERFAFVVRDPHTTLELRVEDEDAVKNDLLGRAQLILADIVGANVGVETKRDVVLLNEKLENDKDRGVLHIRLQWVHDPNSETVARSMRKKKAQAVSVFQALTAKLHLTAPDAVTAEDDDDADEIARVNEAEGVLQDESDHEVEDNDKALRFAAVTVHRAEQLPPLDALHFDKVKDRKPTAPGGGIDAYACAWLSEKPQETVRTRIHTRKGRREELTTNFNETLLLALPVAKPVVKKEETETETVAVAVAVTESEKESETTTTEVKVLSAKTSEVDVTTVTKTEVEITAAGETVVKTEELKTTETETETATVAEVTKTVVTKTETETDKDTEILVEEVDVVEPEPQPVVKAPVNVTLAVMDWDSIGGDEVVSHVELRDVEALVLAKQGKPFWVNLYGAPLIGVKNKAAVDAMNTTSDVGSTFRGRVLLSLKIVTKSAAAYDERHQKRRAAKLPRELYPSSSVYRLRAHFLSAIGLPDPAGKYYVAVSCGMYEISSAQKAAHNRAVEWNETEESDRLVFPDDVNQIPDVVLSLCTGEWEKRVVVSYTRFKAADLLKHGFDDTTVEWVPLKADPTTDAVARNQFPGKVLLRLGFGSLAQANEQIWDQKAMTEVVNRRVPYQIRVRVYGAQDVSGVDRKAPVYLRVQCGDKEITARHVVVDQHSPATVLSLDVNLPQLAFASQVLVHVSEDVPEDEKESSAPYIGTLAVSLQAAKDVSGVDASAIVTHCSSEQLKSNTRPQTPQAKWLPLLSLEDTIESMRVLASVEVIRKMYPDQKLPEPEAIAAAS